MFAHILNGVKNLIPACKHVDTSHDIPLSIRYSGVDFVFFSNVTPRVRFWLKLDWGLFFVPGTSGVGKVWDILHSHRAHFEEKFVA